MNRRAGSPTRQDLARLARRIRSEERARARALLLAAGPPCRANLVAWVWLAGGMVRAAQAPAPISVTRRSPRPRR